MFPTCFADRLRCKPPFISEALDYDTDFRELRQILKIFLLRNIFRTEVFSKQPVLSEALYCGTTFGPPTRWLSFFLVLRYR